MFRLFYILAVTASFSATSLQRASANIIEFWNDPDGWQAATGPHQFIDFTGFPNGTVITNQYQGMGVTFTNFVSIQNTTSYSDDWGLFGHDGIRLEFDHPHRAVAVDHLGIVTFAVFFEGNLVASTQIFVYPGGGPHFSGIISDEPFDEVYMFAPNPPFSSNVISLDSLYWGLPIPSPGVLALVVLAAVAPARRRR